MILDGLLMFSATPAAGGDTPTTGTQNSTNVIDLGVTSGIPTSASGGGARDIGIGDDPAMKLVVQVITAFTVGTSLQAAIQGAADNGSGAPGAFTTMLTGPAVVLANLTVGARILDDDMPRQIPGQAVPRFLRMNYISVGTFSAGAIIATMVLDRHDLPEGITNLLSGYPAGVNVAN